MRFFLQDFFDISSRHPNFENRLFFRQIDQIRLSLSCEILHYFQICLQVLFKLNLLKQRKRVFVFIEFLTILLLINTVDSLATPHLFQIEGRTLYLFSQLLEICWISFRQNSFIKDKFALFLSFWKLSEILRHSLRLIQILIHYGR